MAFDPDAYLQEKQAFDPDAYLKGRAAPAPADDGRRGVDLIPGTAPGRQAPPAPPKPATREAGIGEKILGAISAARHVIASVVPQGLGQAGGFIGGVAGALKTGQFGTAEGADSIQRAMEEGGQRATDAVVTPNTSPVGQEYEARIGEAMSSLPALTATPHGTAGMGARQPGSAVGTGLRAAGDTAAAVKDTAKGATARGLGRMLDVNPEKVKAAGAAEAQGLTVLPHHVSDQTATQKVGQATQHVPLAGGQVKQNQKAFTKAVIRQINPEDKAAQLTPEVVDRALKRAGGQIGDNMGAVEVPQETLAPKLDGIRKSLAVESDETSRIVSNYLGQLDSLATENGGKVPGVALRKLDSEIGAKMRAMGTDKGDLLGQLDNLQDAIRDSAQAHMTPEQAAQTKTARMQYAKTMSLVPAAKDIATTGYLPPSKLLDLATNNKAGKYLLASGKGGEWHDLAKAGALVAEPEGHARLTVGSSVGIGTAGAVAYTNPATAAAAGAGAVGLSRVYNHLGPKLVRRLAKEYDRKAAAEAPPPKAPPPEPLLTEGASGPQDNRPGPGGSKVLPAPEADLMPSARTEAGAAPERNRAGAIAPEGLVPALGDEMPSTGVRDAALEMPAVLGEPGADVQLGAGGPQITAPGPRAGRVLEAPAAEFPMELAVDERPAPRRMVEPRGMHAAVDDKTPPRRVNPEKRGNRAEQIPAVPGRPDMPEVMVAGDLGRADKSPRAPGEVGRDAATGAAMQTEDAALARHLELQRRYGDAGGKLEPTVEQIPAGEATEVSPDAIDPRLARIGELRSRTDSKAVHAALDKRAAEVKKQIKAEAAAKKREADVAELEAAASKTDDPELRQTLLAEANKLRAEKPAIGDVKEGQPPLPKPEVPEKIPAGEATELQPEVVEAPNAPQEVTQQGGLQVEPEGRGVGGQTAEAGPGDRVQRAAPIEGPEPIPTGEATEVTPSVEGVVPEATLVENAAPEPKKVKRMIEPKTAPLDPLVQTPKQFHEAKLKAMAADNGVSLAEVREMYGSDAAIKAHEQEWVDGVRSAFKEGKPLARATLDKLDEARPGAVQAFLHDYPEAKLPEAYQVPGARKVEAAEHAARVENRKAAKRMIEPKATRPENEPIGGQAAVEREAAEAAKRAETKEKNRKLTLAERRANAVLDTSRRSVGGKVMTLREIVDQDVAAGAEIARVEGMFGLRTPDGSYRTEKQIGKTAIAYAEKMIAARDKANKKPTKD